MTILITNLKYLYQRRISWLTIPFLCLFAFGTVDFIKNKDLFALVFPLIWLLLAIGLLVSITTETLTKPFSYCLPGHKSIPRKLLFTIGLTLSFLWSLLFLFNSDASLPQTLINCLSAFLAITIIYWLIVWLAATNHIIRFLIVPLLIFTETRDITLSTLTCIVEKPSLLIPMAIATNFLAWKYWGRPNLAREYFGRPTVNNSRKFINAKLAETFRKKPHSITIPSFIESFFVSQIAKAKSGSIKKYTQGLLYETIGPMLSEKRKFWMFYPIFTLSLLYCISHFPNSGKIMLCGMPTLTALAKVNLRLQSNLLITNGRKEKFYSALTLAIAISAAIALLALLTQILHIISPPLTFLVFESPGSHKNNNLILYSFPQVIIPLSLTMSILYQLKRAKAMLLSILIFAVTTTMIVSLLFVSTSEYSTTTNWLIFTAIALPLAWATFITTLRRISMEACLTN